ncbi:2-hydroxyacid dehydrogenase [Acuticoccus mangrovi]|uniref:Glyoxylate/hydroxypyruvate reductase A n=1 Tax=Acuticoccus mangrovi TaxID=2796142 RepID=A0A934IPN5_9HYPH|nr:glyoxylate/hydroxypyruvate reductase A [Acuticoccus mangrovi]MBJ3775755.1 glyoxylate/hydroxypyruvate reductase A [Acuticoccus mangrovi]
MSYSIVFRDTTMKDISGWADAVAAGLPGVTLARADDLDPETVHYALVFNAPHGFFAQFPNLKLVINLGAGVDALLARDDLPDLPICRLADTNMKRTMAGYVLFAVLRYARDIPVFERAQRRGEWYYVHPTDPDRIRVGILGLGHLGAHAAAEVARQGLQVQGWSRTPKEVPGVRSVHGLDALPDFLATSDILVVVLPQTPETTHLLDAKRLAMLPRGAKVINVARGAIIDEPALVDALASGQVGEATLDVFETEPLPADSPLWAMENVLITPHLASVASATSAAEQVIDTIRRFEAGEPLTNQIDVARGY